MDQVRSAILSAVRKGEGITITPYLPDHLFYQAMDFLGLNHRDMNIVAVLDQDPQKKTKLFLGRIEVAIRDRNTVKERFKNHLIVVLPCLRQNDIIRQLKEDFGVEPQRIAPIDLGKETAKTSLGDTLKSTGKALSGFHPKLPALLGLMERSPNSRIVTHGKQQAIQDLIERLNRDRRTRIGIVGNTGLLDPLLSFRDSRTFQDIHLVDDDRTTTYYAQSRGIQAPLSTGDIEKKGLDAVVVDVTVHSRTRKNFEALPKKRGCRVYRYDPRKQVEDHRQYIAEQIAEAINTLKPDVLYIGHFAYFNLCKQSMALRKNGKKTAILLQIPNNMDFKGPYFDAMFTNYEDDQVFCHILSLLEVPLIHVQGWMTLSHLPLMVKAAVKNSRVVCEFNDISSLFTDWPSFSKIWNRETARLEQISEKALFEAMDGLIFNHDSPSIRGLIQKYGSTLPGIGFHSYPAREFFAEPLPSSQRTANGSRLVFIGTLNSSNLPREYFGDVQLMPMIRRIIGQKIHFDIFLLPYQARNNSLWDYTYLDNVNPYFNLRPGLPPDRVTEALTSYDYGVMFYPFDKDLRVKSNHLEGILPTKFFTFMEAGIPVIVSEELAYVASTVREYGLGIVVSQKDIDSLQSLIDRTDHENLVKNIRAYREEHSMDKHIRTLESFYERVLAGKNEA